MANIPIRHHYLPQSYLRLFGRDEVIWVFDRERNEVRAQKVIDTTVKRHFYSVESNDGTRDTWVESELAKIDGLIPKLVDELRSSRTLDDSRRFDLAFIAAIMMNRTPDFHEGINRVEGGLIKKISKMMFRSEADAARSIAEWKAKDPKASDLDPKELFDFLSKGEFEVEIHRNRSIELMLKLSPEFAKTIARLNICVLHAPDRSAFITTDRPFVIIPPRDTSWIPRWAGVGILTPGAQKYFPLASDLAVVFGDPGDEFRHVTLTPNLVKGVNAGVGQMTDRFLLGRDQALVEAWSKRLDLANQPKFSMMELG